MSLVRKLKPDRNFTSAFIPLSMLPIFGLTTLIFNLSIGMYTLAGLVALFLIYYLYVFIRTTNGASLFICLECAFLIYMFTIMARNVTNDVFNNKEFALAYLFGMIFFGIVIVYLFATRKLKWRGREIFELAAESVDETGNGYTSRPRPVGKVVYSEKQIRGFAQFCARHMIALPYTTSKSLTLILIKMGDEFSQLLGLSGDYRDSSWVNFDLNGEVSVHISQKDYLDYRESPAFDQLCTSLGQVFIDFFEQYNKGEGVRVIDRMDELKISIFS